jgi:ceramide glucosyltransferase
VSAFVVAVAAGYGALLASKAALASWQLRRERQAAGPPPSGDVTVLIPVLSGDPQLAEVLAANATELAASIVLLVDDDDAVAQRLADELRTRFARVRCLSCPPAPDGDNPKTHKLALALPMVATSFVCVLDDDARLPPTSLSALVRALATAELATALPFYLPGRTLPERLLGQFVNNNAALTYLPLLPFCAPVTVNGMAYTLRTATLRGAGGFDAIRRHLTDDLAIADLVRRHGGRIRQLAAPVAMRTSLPGAIAWWRQMHRWFVFALLLLRRQTLAMNLAILVLHGVPPLLLQVLLVACFVDPSAALALAGVLLLRAMLLMALQRRITGASRHHLLLSPLAELLQPLHLLHATLVRTIRWRRRRYRVIDNDQFHTVA